jgi:hypothetical protein
MDTKASTESANIRDRRIGVLEDKSHSHRR